VAIGPTEIVETRVVGDGAISWQQPRTDPVGPERTLVTIAGWAAVHLLVLVMAVKRIAG
jgi:hypothetical protein